MRIGIASNLDIEVFKPYFEKKEDKDWIQNYARENSSPAVNTLCLTYLKMGHFLRIFTLANETRVLKSNNVEIYAIQQNQTYPIKYLWGVWLNAKSIKDTIALHINDLNAIHAHWTYDYAYAASAFTSQLSVVCTVRDWAPYIWTIVSLKDKITWTFRWLLNQKVLRQKNVHFIANSPYTANLLSKYLKKPIPTIPNSVKDSMFCESEHVFPGHLRIITISSSHDKRKNIVALIRAYALVLKKYPNAELDIICPMLPKNSTAVKEWNSAGLIDGKINFHGSVPHDNLKNILDLGTVMVCPSLEETFGNTLLEGFSRGIPVIGGINSGAVPYVLHNGEVGYLCDVSSPQKIAEQIIFVYEHLDDARNKAEKAKVILKEEYAEHVVASKYIDYLKKIKH